MIDYEHCYFCKCYCDPLGCDTQEIIEDLYLWCGQCMQGQRYKFRNFSDESLEILKQTAQEWLDNSGLDWDHRGGRSNFVNWARFVDYFDLIYHINQELERRNEENENKNRN